jgi:hypothetical protein
MKESTPPSNNDGAAAALLAVRPDEGSLARGVWEAPPWAFYASGAVVVLAILAFSIHLARSSAVPRRRRLNP